MMVGLATKVDTKYERKMKNSQRKGKGTNMIAGPKFDYARWMKKLDKKETKMIDRANGRCKKWGGYRDRFCDAADEDTGLDLDQCDNWVEAENAKCQGFKGCKIGAKFEQLHCLGHFKSRQTFFFYGHEPTKSNNNEIGACYATALTKLQGCAKEQRGIYKSILRDSSTDDFNYEFKAWIKREKNRRRFARMRR